MNFIMHIIYTRVNTIYGYNWYVLFCYLLTASAYAQLAVRARAAQPTSDARSSFSLSMRLTTKLSPRLGRNRNQSQWRPAQASAGVPC